MIQQMIIDQITIMKDELKDLKEWAKKEKKKIIRVVNLPNNTTVVFVER